MIVLKLQFAVAGALLLITVGIDAVFADEPAPAESKIYQPAGAPADPKVSVHWNRYHDYSQSIRLLRQLAEAHPKICRLQTLGKSYGGRNMWVMTITDPTVGKESEKPAFWIDGGIHANEIQAVEVVLYTAWYLCESHGRNKLIDRLLKERTFYLMPMMSPDSRDAHMRRPNTTHSPRSGQRPVDDDRDGLVDEDGPDDLDGDGHITQMRIRDPNGRYKPHPDFPQLMIRCKDDEQGSYTLLGSEGVDNDDDGRVNEDGDGYYDPNRDWAYHWQPKSVQRGAHHYPFSVLENRMVADFIAAHPNIAGAQSYHNTGGMILYGPGVKGEKNQPADQAVYDAIAAKGEMMLPGYRKLNIANDLYEVYGGELDWLHGMQGVFGFTNELFTGFNFFRKGSPSREDQRRFNRYLLLGEGLVEWHEVEHPQYGKIEVGGLKKNWLRQPPSFLLEEECHRNMAFTLYHADQMPQVAVSDVQVKQLGGGLHEVTATVVNHKLTPTHSAHDVMHKITRPDLVSIAGKDLKVITALVSDDPLLRRAGEQKRNPGVVRLKTVRGMRAVYVRWLVKGAGPYTVTVNSVKGGVGSRIAK
ncbi:MAG: peptidase M14 [Planctomycetes bacterium]|nr:peptidase M14 [Planctomycetota bacterium]